MISEADYPSRGWDVVPMFVANNVGLSPELLDEMTKHPEAPGESSWGTRNILYSFILSMRPKIVLEIGSHIGLGSVVIGTALKANGFGRSFHLEPQEHYFTLLESYLAKAQLSDVSTPLKMASTDERLARTIGEKADIIFLDANHAYSHALRDLKILDSLIANNGLIFLDDVGSAHSAAICPEQKGGVRQALKKFAQQHPNYAVTFFEPPFWLNPCGLAIACKQTKAQATRKRTFFSALQKNS